MLYAFLLILAWFLFALWLALENLKPRRGTLLPPPYHAIAIPFSQRK